MSLSTIIQWSFSCDRCGADKTYSQSVCRDGVFPQPEYPEGWTRVGYLDFCEKHQIEVHDPKNPDAEPTFI